MCVCVCIFLTAVCSSYFLFDGTEISPKPKRGSRPLCAVLSAYSAMPGKKDTACYNARDITTIAVLQLFVLFLWSRFVKVCLVRMLGHRLHHEQK